MRQSPRASTAVDERIVYSRRREVNPPSFACLPDAAVGTELSQDQSLLSLAILIMIVRCGDLNRGGPKSAGGRLLPVGPPGIPRAIRLLDLQSTVGICLDHYEPRRRVPNGLAQSGH